MFLKKCFLVCPRPGKHDKTLTENNKTQSNPTNIICHCVVAQSSHKLKMLEGKHISSPEICCSGSIETYCKQALEFSSTLHMLQNGFNSVTLCLPIQKPENK